jgi:hypothetical protein
MLTRKTSLAALSSARGHRGGELAPADVWALGSTIFVALGGYPPFGDAFGGEFIARNSGEVPAAVRLGALEGLFARIQSGDFSFPAAHWRKVGPNARDFISRCLTVDPAARPTAAELLTHPWFCSRGWRAVLRPELAANAMVVGVLRWRARRRWRVAAATVLAAGRFEGGIRRGLMRAWGAAPPLSAVLGEATQLRWQRSVEEAKAVESFLNSDDEDEIKDSNEGRAAIRRAASGYFASASRPPPAAAAQAWEASKTRSSTGTGTFYEASTARQRSEYETKEVSRFLESDDEDEGKEGDSCWQAAVERSASGYFAPFSGQATASQLKRFHRCLRF